MVIDGKKAFRAHVQQDLSGGGGIDLAALSTADLKKSADSAVQDIKAFRFAITRIELLDGYRKLMRDMLEDCRVVVDAHGTKAMVKKIDKVLRETAEA